jgi:hypothetical protein
MQRLLRTVDGNADAVRDELHVYAVERLGSGGVLMLDETGCIKKRAKSAGVVRLEPPASGSAQAAPERTSEAVDRSTAAERADLEEDRRRQQDLDDGELGGES